MGELGLAVVFCVLQVTLLAAVASVCYLCSRRSHPGFRSLIASTGVFVVLALSLLCLSPYPNWVEVVDRGIPESSRNGLTGLTGGTLDPDREKEERPVRGRERGFNLGAVRTEVGPPNDVSLRTEVRRSPHDRNLESDQDLPLSRVGRPAPSVAPDVRVPSREVWFSRLSTGLQRVAGLLVEFRGWLAGRLEFLVRWGWLPGVMLLAGIIWNLLRLAVGWWQLHRFRQRSAPIDSQSLFESLDIVQAALSLRSPVELRETVEMTSPATIGWWRPVVILPADWEEWNEEERLGVLAHELAHISRHDFLTGLFSQLVLSLHFYHPLINWLVNRLHLEQELAADAAAVRVLGGEKPYLKMLAGMALKDHTASLPGVARTFFPQSGTLMARVELLRGNKVEAGEGSFSWRATVRGVLVCVGLVLAGLRPLAGSDGAKSQQVPLSSAFVPETAAACLVWRPEQIPGTHPLATLLFGPTDHWPQELRAGLSQISLFWLEADVTSGEESGSPVPDGVVLNFDSPLIRDAAFEHLRLHPDGNPSYRVLGGQAAHPALPRKAGEREILLCRDEAVWSRSQLAAATGNSAAWKAAWGRAAEGDVVVTFRPDLLSRFRLSEANYTAVLEDLVGQLADWGQAGEFGFVSLDLNRNRLHLQLVPREGFTPRGLMSAVDSLKRDWKRRCSNPPLENVGEQGDFDPVSGNDWCRLMLEDCRAEVLSDRLEIESDLAALMGIGFRLGSEMGESPSFEELWSQHQAARFGQAFGILRSALLAYRAEHGEFPPPVLRRDPGEPPYSWRVALLPYLGRPDLFNQYRFDRSWNSPENLRLLSQIPDVYRAFGSWSNTTPICHGASLSSSDASLILIDWTEVESLVVFGETSVSIPWTSPIDAASRWEASRLRPVAPAGGLAVLKSGDLEQRIWSIDDDLASSSRGTMVP